MKMGLCGTGTIGACLATLMVGNGVETAVIGRSDKSLERCRAMISSNFDFLIEHGRVTESQKTAAMKLLKLTTDYAALSGASFVMEAVAEDPAVKEAVYAAVEANVAEDAIIASSTSALTPQELSAHLSRPERFVVAHPFQPAHLQPLVELAGSDKTEPAVMDKAKDLLENTLKRQVVVLKKAVPGFLVNRIAQAMFRECIHLIEDDVATAADLDKAIKYTVGMRYASIGLLEYFDDVGFDLEKNIAGSVYPSLCSTHDIQQRVEAGIAAGETGLKAGKGLYDWSEKDLADYQRRKTEPFVGIFNWTLPEA